MQGIFYFYPNFKFTKWLQKIYLNMICHLFPQLQK